MAGWPSLLGSRTEVDDRVAEIGTETAAPAARRPPRESFYSGRRLVLPPCNLDLRLVVQPKLAMIDGPAKAIADSHPFAEFLVENLVV